MAGGYSGFSNELLSRVVIWAPAVHNEALQRHLCRRRHPFVVIQDEEAAAYFRLPRGGLFFELFTLPIDIGLMGKKLRSLEERGLLKANLEIAGLPVLVIRMVPIEGPDDDPFRGINAALRLLPTWRPRRVRARRGGAAAAGKKKKRRKRTVPAAAEKKTPKKQRRATAYEGE